MADTTVDNNADNIVDSVGLYGPYWSDVSTGVIVYADNASELSYARTTDKGANWALTVIEGVAEVKSIACWYDKETPGDSGTLIHILWLDDTDEEAKYVTLDVAADTLGTIRIVDSTITVSITPVFNRTAITKAVDGTIVVAFSTQTEIECYKSSDNFATAGTAISDPYETATEEDWLLLFPADVDAGDVVGIFWDRSADEISIKMFDSSADSWTETSIATSMVDDVSFFNMDGSVRNSNKHLYLAAHSDADSTGDDILTWDLTVNSIASPGVSAKTNVVTNVGESAQIAMFINQQNNDVYVAYLKGGTWLDATDAVFHISTDGMGSWGTEQAYSEATADDMRTVQAGRTVGDGGGRYHPTWFNTDLNDIFVNETNDIEIAAAGAAATRRYSLTLTGVG